MESKIEKLQTGERICIRSGSDECILIVSKVDGAVVKLFDEKGLYRQMALVDLKKLHAEGYISIRGRIQEETGGQSVL